MPGKKLTARDLEAMAKRWSPPRFSLVKVSSRRPPKGGFVLTGDEVIGLLNDLGLCLDDLRDRNRA